MSKDAAGRLATTGTSPAPVTVYSGWTNSGLSIRYFTAQLLAQVPIFRDFGQKAPERIELSFADLQSAYLSQLTESPDPQIHNPQTARGACYSRQDRQIQAYPHKPICGLSSD